MTGRQSYSRLREASSVAWLRRAGMQRRRAHDAIDHDKCHSLPSASMGTVILLRTTLWLNVFERVDVTLRSTISGGRTTEIRVPPQGPSLVLALTSDCGATPYFTPHFSRGKNAVCTAAGPIRARCESFPCVLPESFDESIVSTQHAGPPHLLKRPTRCKGPIALKPDG